MYTHFCTICFAPQTDDPRTHAYQHGYVPEATEEEAGTLRTYNKEGELVGTVPPMTDEDFESFKERWGLDKLKAQHPVVLSDTKAWISIPLDEAPELAERYVAKIEVQVTDELCLCQWRVHPDDIELKEAQKKFRKVRMDEHPRCPVHTKIGFLLGFLKFVREPDEVSEEVTQ